LQKRFPKRLLHIGKGNLTKQNTREKITKALRFRQEGHPELKCYSAPIKSTSKIWRSGTPGVAPGACGEAGRGGGGGGETD